LQNACVIACRTLQAELEFVFNKTGLALPVAWIESGLHNAPEKLHAKLQESLDSVKGYTRILLLFGICGNAVLNLKCGNFELVMPRVDDCISLLIGSPCKRSMLSREYAAYFLTEGWMRGERNLWAEYQHCVQKYGERQANEIAKTMYGHYRTLALLDTGVSPVGPLLDSTKNIADTLGLQQKVLPADTSYIEEFLHGPWPKERFIVKGPFGSVLADDLVHLL
jgi:hypothetical protein